MCHSTTVKIGVGWRTRRGLVRDIARPQFACAPAWLVKDPETGWSWAAFVNPADIDLFHPAQQIQLANQTYSLKNSGIARVDYILGEVYWKCAIGETVSVMDFAHGNEVISREHDNEEVNYSHSRLVSWQKIAAAFDLPVSGPGVRLGLFYPALPGSDDHSG